MMWKEKTDQESAADLVVGFIQLLSQSSAILAGAVEPLVHGVVMDQRSTYRWDRFIPLPVHFVQEISRCLRHYYNDIYETRIGFWSFTLGKFGPK